MTFQVSLDKFSGPLQLLLGLIENQELPITEVSLAKVAEDYLRYIDENEVPAEELADFLVVATKLLLIKSKTILPNLELDEEESASTLELQLRMYKEFVEASKLVEARYGEKVMIAREKAEVIKRENFVPPEGTDKHVLQDSFARLLKRLEPFFLLKKHSIEKVVSVQERIGQLRDAIHTRSRMSFKEVVKGTQSKVEVVVSFLALLELMKQNIVKVAQSKTFEDITISRAE